MTKKLHPQEDHASKQGFFSRLVGCIWKKSVSTVEDTVDAVDQLATKAGEMTGKAVDTAVGTASSVVETAGAVTGKAMGAVGGGIVSLVNSLVNTTKFITSSQYRNEEGYPWIRSVVRENWAKVSTELNESQEMMEVLWKYSRGVEISEEEQKAAREQLHDIVRVVPALGIFCLPGGALLLPLLARALPWDLMPSAFRNKVTEEFGEDALEGELKQGEEIPTDSSASTPEDLEQKMAEEAPQLVEEAAKIKTEEK